MRTVPVRGAIGRRRGGLGHRPRSSRRSTRVLPVPPSRPSGAVASDWSRKCSAARAMIGRRSGNGPPVSAYSSNRRSASAISASASSRIARRFARKPSIEPWSANATFNRPSNSVTGPAPGCSSQRRKRPPPLRRDAVGRAGSLAGGGRLGRCEPEGDEALGFLVDHARGSGPHVADAAIHLLSEFVGGPVAHREQAQDGVGRGGRRLSHLTFLLIGVCWTAGYSDAE